MCINCGVRVVATNTLISINKLEPLLREWMNNNLRLQLGPCGRFYVSIHAQSSMELFIEFNVSQQPSTSQYGRHTLGDVLRTASLSSLMRAWLRSSI